jgi:hypothetical protein
MFNFLAGDDWFLNIIRLHLFPKLAGTALSFETVRKEFFKRLSQIGINYRHHALSQHKGDENFNVKAGDRLPYFLVDGTSVFDQLREPKFHLLVFSDGEGDFQAMKSDLESKYGEKIDFHVVPIYPQIAEIFGTEKPFQVLLRPDNYIAFLSPNSTLEQTKSYFAKIGGTK